MTPEHADRNRAASVSSALASATSGETLSGVGVPHILFVESGPGFGGATRCLLSLVDLCVDRNWRVTVATAYPIPQLQQQRPACKLIPLYRKGSFRLGRHLRRGKQGRMSSIASFWTAAAFADFPMALSLARYAKRNGVSLIHGNNELLANRTAILTGKLAALPVVSHQRGWSYACRLTGVLAGWSNRLVAVSDAVATQLLQLGIDRERIVRVYDGIDAGRFARAGALREAARRKLGFESQDEVVGLPAVLVPWKGHDLFLRAFARLAAKRPRAKALLVGASPAGAPDISPAIQRQVEALGLQDRVRMTGHVDDMPAMYAVMDLVVHSSVKPEPFGLVVAEAMAAGKAVVAANAGGPPEMIQHGHSGWLYPMGDETALAQALETLLANAPLRGQLADRAGQQARRFSPDAFRTAMLGVYRDLLPTMSDKRNDTPLHEQAQALETAISAPRCFNPSP